MSMVTHAQIEPTTRCNFICGFCAGRSMAQGDLGWDAFVRFLDTHPDLAHVELQGEGEPLLHARFFDMAAACVARGIRVSVITNGSLLTEERVDRLLAAGLQSIHVSMESSDPARFEAIRGGKFAKVRDGLARLIAERNGRGLSRPVVGLAVTVLKDTVRAVEGIVGLYEELGLDGGIVAQPLQKMPVYADRYDEAMAAQVLPPELVPAFLALRQQLARRAPVKDADDFFYYSLFRSFDPARQGCPWLERGAYLGQNGQVTACCFMKDDVLGDAAAAPDVIDARRAALRAELERGAIPAACRGCGTAAAVARHRVRPVSARIS